MRRPVVPSLALLACAVIAGLVRPRGPEWSEPGAPAPRTQARAGSLTPPHPSTLSAAELSRLRAKTALLSAELDEKTALLDTALDQLEAADRQLQELRRPLEVDMASSTLRASLRPGEGVVTGGYRLPDGHRLFAFLDTDPRPGGDLGVMALLYSVPDGQTRALGLHTLNTEAANTLQHGEVWLGAEIDALTERLRSSPGTRPLGLGATALLADHTSDFTIASDPPVKLRLHYTRGADDELDLEVRLESEPSAAPSTELTPTPPEPPQP